MEKLIFRYLLICIIALLDSSCKQKKDELSGHWISKGYFEGKEFFTVDFEKESHAFKDSASDLIVTDKNNFGPWGCDKNYLRKRNSIYEFNLSDAGPHTLYFKGDSLYIEGYSYKTGALIKVDEKLTLYSELFHDTGLEIDLPESGIGDTVRALDWRRWGVNLNLSGKRTNRSQDTVEYEVMYLPSQQDSLDSEQDSITINCIGAYISRNEIPILINELQSKLIPEEIHKLTFYVCADRLVPKEFIIDLVERIRQVDPLCKIYQTTFDYKNQKVYFRRI